MPIKKTIAIIALIFAISPVMMAQDKTSNLRTLVMPGFSYNQSQYSYSLMIGACDVNGFYMRAKSDFHFDLTTAGSCDEYGLDGGVQSWLTGESKKSRLAFTVGYLRQLAKPLYLYLGGGWGQRILAWERYATDQRNEYVVVAPYSFIGFEAEAGAIIRLGAFTVSAGVQTNQFQYYEANVGLGIMF